MIWINVILFHIFDEKCTVLNQINPKMTQMTFINQEAFYHLKISTAEKVQQKLKNTLKQMLFFLKLMELLVEIL